MQRPAATARMVPVTLSGAPSVVAVTLTCVAVLHHVYAKRIAPECLVLVLLLWTIDDASRGIRRDLTCLLVLVSTLASPTPGSSVSMLTHGFLAVALLRVFGPRSGWPRREDPAAVRTVPGGDLLRSGGLPGAR